MKKSSLRTLQERFESSQLEQNNTFSQVLKRKRLEKKRTLEELAQGICSPSYLSKIENAIVKVDEYYYQLLFEKLDIPFEDMKKERDSNLFQNLIRNYLINNKSEIEAIVNRTIKMDLYCETEIELIVLFSNIIQGSYDEAKILINKIEDIRNSLTNKELLFFVFSTTLYFYKTNQSDRARQQAQVLVEINYDDMFLKAAVYDLAADIFYVIGNYPYFYRFWFHLQQIDPTILGKRFIHHKLQQAVLNSKKNYEPAITELENERINIDSFDGEQLEDYYFYLGCAYFLGKKYEKILEFIYFNPMSARIIALIASALDRLDNTKLALEYFEIISKFTFSKYEPVFCYHVEYVRQKFEKYGYQRLMAYIKNVIFPAQKKFHHEFFFQIELQNFLELGYSMGRYKDTLKNFHDFFDED